MYKFIILLLIIFISCADENPSSDTNIKIITNYSGKYYILITNENKALLTWRIGKETWKENQLVESLGELSNLRIEAEKDLIDSNDLGELSIRLYMEDNLLKKSVALLGINETILEYQF